MRNSDWSYLLNAGDSSYFSLEVISLISQVWAIWALLRERKHIEPHLKREGKSGLVSRQKSTNLVSDKRANQAFPHERERI